MVRFRAWLLCMCVSATSACASASAVVMPRSAPAQASAAAASRSTPAPQDAPPPELFVRCEDRANCPNAVGMLVVDSGVSAEPERCTATLIDSDRVLTVSHCLAPAERRDGAACARTWIAFPETADAPAEWIACAHVVTATEVAFARSSMAEPR
jgi:hypothetical protein